MGKSPAKWIKSVLFSKKTLRSNSTKGRDGSKTANNKGHAGGKQPAFSENSPVISEPVLVSAHNNGSAPALGRGENSNSHGEGVVVRAASQDVERQGITGSDTANNPENLREEQAAIKAQAAFRGYLARRAFRALKGIIRLQALIRGHLVRRQAVSTLRAMWAIVKLQAVVRGRNVRLSCVAVDVSARVEQEKLTDAKSLDRWKEKVSSNAYVRRLLSSPTAIEALHFQYDQIDPNSVSNWLERWTISEFWKPISQPKRVTDAKPQTRKASYAMETESAKLKRNVRKSSAMTVEPCQTSMNSEPEKPKRNVRKFSSSPADSVPDNQLTELEKVKRNLRKVTSSMSEASKVSSSMTETPKVSSSMIEAPKVSISSKVSNSMTEASKVSITMTETSDNQDVQCELPSRSAREVSSPPDIREACNGNLLEKGKKGSLSPDLETPVKPVTTEEQADEVTVVASAVEVKPLQNIDNEENVLMRDGEVRSKEEQPSSESLKTSRRRSSISTKSEYAENGVQNTPVLPSYMAATESAKAKLRGSPRFASDSVEKNGLTRRHSLPSSNGKLNSHSPRTQRPIQSSGKEGMKSDKSLLSSRDGNDRPIKVEWRR